MVREGLPYHRLHEAGLPGWWRPVRRHLHHAGRSHPDRRSGRDPPVRRSGTPSPARTCTTSLSSLVDLQKPTPAGLAYLNLALASMIPLTWFVNRVLHGLLPRWLASVQPRIRWRFLAACLGISVVALFATLVVSAVVPGQSDDVGSKANAFTSTTRDYLLVIAFLTPLQAAGEEYLFRGYLTQAFGGLFHTAWVAGPACPRSSSGWPTGSARASRSSSTASRSGWSPASSWCSPADSRPASRCTC